jgi:hypothetical protein
MVGIYKFCLHLQVNICLILLYHCFFKVMIIINLHGKINLTLMNKLFNIRFIFKRKSKICLSTFNQYYQVNSYSASLNEMIYKLTFCQPFRINVIFVYHSFHVDDSTLRHSCNFKIFLIFINRYLPYPLH